MTEEIRQIAGRYHLIARIGGGAMGAVWKGEDRYLDRVVAVKELLLPQGLGEEKAAAAKGRAMREARIAARLQHPHAISVFSVVEDGDRPWLIMEYLPSKSLAALLQDNGPLPVDEVIGIACQLGSALAAAHQAGIVHRDVKPANVLIGEDGTVKVTDFGIARAAGDVTRTATGEVVGTPAFLAPEVARGEEASFSSDVFSLGATLYTAVEGVPPFGYGDNAIALLYRVSSGAVEPPTRAGRLTPLLLRLLEVNAESRPTMAEVLGELRALATAGEVRSTLPEPLTAEPDAVADAVSGSAGARRKRHRFAMLAGAMALVVLTVAVLAIARNLGDRDVVATTPETTGPTSTLPAPPAGPSPQPSSPQPVAPNAATSRQAMEKAVTDYYALMPNDVQAGYARLTEKFKQARSHTFADYAAFWHQMKSVTVSGVTAGNGNTVAADITYVFVTGKTAHEHHVYTLTQQNGSWVLDEQRVVQQLH